MGHGSARLVVAVFLLATALVLAQEDAGRYKPAASMLPPAPFVSSETPPLTTPHENITTTPAPHNTTTTHVTPHPTTHNTTTAHVTTPHPTTHNTTTTHVTTHPTTHNTTTANATTPHPTTHNTTTTHVTTHPTTHNTTTANVTTPHPTTHNTTANTTTPRTTTPNPPKPTSPTNITVGNYTVKSGDKLCVMVQAAIQVHVNNNKMAGSYIVPGDAKSNGSCDSNTASLYITLDHGHISMNFGKNVTSNVVFVNAVAVNLSYAFKAGVLLPLQRTNASVQLFSTATGHSYSCKSDSVFLGDGAYLEFSKERLQAFNFTNNQFGPNDLCKADQPDYRVAIGVGVVLLILIIIVVVAYLISRRRRTDGYQTL